LKKLFLSMICIALIGFLTACGGGDDEANKDNTTTEDQAADEDTNEEKVNDENATDEGTSTADAGEADTKFQQSCSSCHGSDLVSGGAPDLDKIGTKYSKDEILAIIENGKGNMPANLLSGDDAEEVASWLSEKK
jgi:cytochrome c551